MGHKKFRVIGSESTEFPDGFAPEVPASARAIVAAMKIQGKKNSLRHECQQKSWY